MAKLTATRIDLPPVGKLDALLKAKEAEVMEV